MEEALRKIEAALREKQPVSRIDGLIPVQPVRAADQTGGLGIEHYGKVSMVVDSATQEAAPSSQQQTESRQETPQVYQDAASRIGAGSKELSLDELSAQSAPSNQALKTQQLGGSRFHELSLDDLSSPPGTEEGSAG